MCLLCELRTLSVETSFKVGLSTEVNPLTWSHMLQGCNHGSQQLWKQGVSIFFKFSFYSKNKKTSKKTSFVVCDIRQWADIPKYIVIRKSNGAMVGDYQ